ncbi:MAG: type I restriction endonuclease [Gammaproteobacteria bacterium]|nr:type I restriction endonuclease [Gammaproteobacteria bacterium]
MSLKDAIFEIRRGLGAGTYPSEAAVSQGIVLRLLSMLGWQTFDMQTVIPEYSIRGRRVDYALCYPRGKPIAFIEVKRVGQGDGAEEQLFEYAFHEGIPLAILTDGAEWHFFLPGEQGDYDERRVYKLNIPERDDAECVHRLERYLRYDAFVDETAIASAREDYQDVSRKRVVRRELPRAWSQLVVEQDELLIELVAEKVESLCGFKPDSELVADFLLKHALSEQSIPLIIKDEGDNSDQQYSKKVNKKPDGGIVVGKNRGKVTTQRLYEVPILQAISELGGKGEVREILAIVEQRLGSVINELDRERLKGGEVRWKNSAQWARHKMVKDGRLKSSSPRGVWEITAKGRSWLSSNSM